MRVLMIALFCNTSDGGDLENHMQNLNPGPQRKEKTWKREL